MTDEELHQACIDVLVKNDRVTHTIPADGLYPHQWLWDSCFIAIGQRHYDVDRAKLELKSLLRGQWRNGMLPNMILSHGKHIRHSPELWRSDVSPHSPDFQPTSGITQPPMLAEAVVRVGEHMSKNERKIWYQQMYPALLKYHQWLYKDRDPTKTGLIVQLHPWETGLDNTPPWMAVIHEHAMPFWIKIIRATGLDKLITLFRADRKYALPGERLTTVDALTFFSLQRQMRRHQYNSKKILSRPYIAIADVNFNAILIRANHHLRLISKTLQKPIPKTLRDNMAKTEQAFEELWDPYSNNYFSKDIKTNQLIKVPTIGTLLALYSGHISQDRAASIVKQLHNKQLYAAPYPVSTTPLTSDWFDEHLYWQGPTWINTNWLIIDGLRRYGFTEEAERLHKTTIELVRKNGPREYFSPKNGSPAGAHNFSWTAALTLDLFESQ